MTATGAYGLIGVGIGVFNLALAALLEDNGYRDAVFFDRSPSMTWHDGLLLESSELQVHHLKDLVTPVDPTSRFSFLNYLRHRGVLYQFLNHRGGTVTRNQFQHYFRWVADSLPTTRFGSTVESIGFDGEHFRVVVNGVEHRSRDIAVATGLRAVLPDCAVPHLGDRVFHAQQYRQRREGLGGLRIAVVGGGQTGAEVVRDVMETVPHRELAWYGRRLAFSHLEDSSFLNEMYAPSFATVFRQAASAKRQELLDRFARSSDGISQALADDIYRLAYERRFFAHHSYDYDFRSGQDLVGLDRDGDRYQLTLRSWLDDAPHVVPADAVVLATGFAPSVWDMLGDVIDTSRVDKCSPEIGPHFEVRWPNGATNHIFVQNGSRDVIGLADPNLSIAAWRAAMIANRVIGREIYSPAPDTPLVTL